MKLKKLEELSPQTILPGLFILSLFSFLIVDLLPTIFYRTVDASSYLVFHNCTEIFSIIVSFSIAGVGWYTYDQSRNRHALFLSCAFIAVGLIDLMHMLSYPGMPALVTPNSNIKSQQLWLAARMVTAMAFLASAFVYQNTQNRLLSKKSLLIAALIVSGFVYIGVIYFPSSLPITFIEGSGLTPFKIYSEYLIIFLFCLSFAAYWNRFIRTRDKLLIYFLCAFIFCIFSELAFTLYKGAFDTFNVMGHIYKVAAFFFIYMGIFITSVKQPYSVLQKEIIERKRAEEAHSMLASIVEFSDDVIIGMTLDGIIISWNPGAENVYGYCADEVTGKTISILIPPGHLDEIPNNLERIKQGESIKHYESVRIRKDGRLIDVSLTISPIKDSAGRIIGASKIARDITDRKLMEEQLRAASLYTRSLIEVSLDPLVTISPEGKITDVNKATELVTGVSREQLIGSDFSDYFMEPEKAREGYQQVFEKGYVKDFPLAIRHVSGSATDILYNAAVYRDAAGNVAGVFAAARDITERKRNEVKLYEASLYTRSLIEVSLDPLVTISKDGKISDVNKATELVTGISREKLIGSDFSYYFTEHEKAREGYQEVFNKGFVKDYPLAIRHISGNITEVLYNASVYKDAAGNVAGVFAAARDITERKRAEDALLRAHDELELKVDERTSQLSSSLKEKETLLKEVHHRVKNNLQIVSSILQLQSTYIKDKQAIVAFGEGRNRVNTMALIHEKLYRSKDLGKINFAEYVEELATNLFFFYGINSGIIKLKINIKDVFFDVNTAIPCGLIINELVSNSLKYAFPEGRKGEVNITLLPVKEKFVLTISDNGAGFPADLDFGNTETLGLKLVISLANQLDGTIELERNSGTIFKITFSELKYKEKIKKEV